MASKRVYLLGGARMMLSALGSDVDVISLDSIEQLLEYPDCGVLLLQINDRTSISDMQSLVAKHCRCVVTIAISEASSPTSDQIEDALRTGCLAVLPRSTTPQGLREVCETAWRLADEQNNADRLLIRTLSLLSALDSRERQILQYVKEGLTNREMADAMDAGRRSVDRWRAAVMQKVDVGSTVELITLMARVDEYTRQGGWLPRLVARISQQRLANLLPSFVNSTEEKSADTASESMPR